MLQSTSLQLIVLSREYLMSQRQALLMQLDAIERLLEIAPRTAELRKEAKRGPIVEMEQKEERTDECKTMNQSS